MNYTKLRRKKVTVDDDMFTQEEQAAYTFMLHYLTKYQHSITVAQQLRFMAVENETRAKIAGEEHTIYLARQKGFIDACTYYITNPAVTSTGAGGSSNRD